MKAVVAAFNLEKALVGAFSVITNLRMELFQALIISPLTLATVSHPGLGFNVSLPQLSLLSSAARIVTVSCQTLMKLQVCPQR